MIEQREMALDIRKKFFTIRVVSHRNRLLRNVVYSPSLKVFKVGLDWDPEQLRV